MCSRCHGERVDGCIQHSPTCEFYRARDMFEQHPDLIDLEAYLMYWDGEEDAA